MASSPRGIVLLEGADSAGKTTLARHLVEEHRARYLHSTVRENVWRWHVGALRRAIRLAETELVVMDRHWLSEQVYGTVFRGGPAYDVGARCLDRVLRRYGALNVLCVPGDLRAQEARWAANRDAGKREHFPRVREVIAAYADLRWGNVAVPGTTYLAKLTRWQDYTERDDVLVYDLDAHQGEAGVTRFVDLTLRRLRQLRVTCDDLSASRQNLSGRLSRGARGWLMIGEAASPATRPGWPRWPWTWHDGLSAATWLNRAAHALDLDETRCLWTNALEADDHLPRLLARDELRVLAFGKKAAARCRALGRAADAELPHPQYHRRFHNRTGVDGYARILEEGLKL